MTMAAPVPGSLAAFMLSGQQAGPVALGYRLVAAGLATRGGTLSQVSDAARYLIGRELSAAANRLLDVDVGQVLIAGWRAYAALREAAEASLADPHTRHVVDLATHRIVSNHHPYLEVFVNGAPAARIDLDLILTFTIAALAAVVSRGRLVELRSGDCLLSAVVSVGGVEVVHREGTLDLHLTVPLGDYGLPLISKPAQPSNTL